MHPASQTSVDAFADALWLEDGLSANTLAAYRRDLTLLARWLASSQSLALLQVQEHHLQLWFAERHAVSKATSANRRLTKRRALLVAAPEKAKFVYTLSRDGAAKLAVSSPLEAHRARTLCFDAVGLDVGFENPAFACLEVDVPDDVVASGHA